MILFNDLSKKTRHNVKKGVEQAYCYSTPFLEK